METLHRIWSRNGGEWGLVLETIGDTEVGCHFGLGLFALCVGSATGSQVLTRALKCYH